MGSWSFIISCRELTVLVYLFAFIISVVDSPLYTKKSSVVIFFLWQKTIHHYSINMPTIQIKIYEPKICKTASIKFNTKYLSELLRWSHQERSAIVDCCNVNVSFGYNMIPTKAEALYENFLIKLVVIVTKVTKVKKKNIKTTSHQVSVQQMMILLSHHQQRLSKRYKICNSTVANPV